MLGERSGRVAALPRALEVAAQVEETLRRRRHTAARWGADWERRLVAIVVAVDVAAVLLACALASLVRFQNGAHVSAWRYVVLTVVLSGGWLAAMWLSRAHEARFLGLGSEEFKRACNAAVRFIAAIATLSYAVNSTMGRRFVVIALPLAAILDLLGRYAARKLLMRLRQRGRCLYRVVVAGSPDSVADLIRITRRAQYAGLRVVGCCVDQRRPIRVSSIEGVPVLGDLSTVAAAVLHAGATTVAVTSCGEVTATALRRLAWELEGTGVDILVAPALIDVTGPRIHVRPVAELPLLHLEEPELSGGRRLLKAGFDRVVALAALLVMLPALLVLALAVRLTSPGPVLFRQVRCGKGGDPFTIYKFRSMYVDAEAKLETLLGANERAEGLLFKIRRDPRVTGVGRWLRRYSLDELPQLLNVLKGDMSLVGPRPPLPSEVARYESDVRRRLLVKPGLTGLWQVSGRSDLTWDESVRLDLQYVENWSLALDFLILWKTVFAVVRGSGAY